MGQEPNYIDRDDYTPAQCQILDEIARLITSYNTSIDPDTQQCIGIGEIDNEDGMFLDNYAWEFEEAETDATYDHFSY